MTLVLTSILTAFLATSPAQAADYPILKTYETLATEVAEATKIASTEAELDAIRTSTRELIGLGTEIVKLYGEKNPNCQAQFDVMIQEIPDMETMTVDDLHDRYHDGTGLPTAPRHCYFGRSQIVHPAMNIVRLQSAWTEVTREEVLEETEEVIEHLARIQKNLDNPPN
ncbi:MAG: hypothetical protein AAB250_17765 [Bdellovibrionota bacterium]